MSGGTSCTRADCPGGHLEGGGGGGGDNLHYYTGLKYTPRRAPASRYIVAFILDITLSAINYLRSVNISKPVTDVYPKQVYTVEHERNILFGGKKASVCKKPQRIRTSD